MYIYLNPQYVIRNENNCSYIIAKSALITAKLEYAMAFASVVPPSIGYILSHIGEGELNASIENIANTLNIKPDLIDKFTSNPQPIGFRGNLLVKRQKFFYCTYSLGITETS